ncbi:hypothetical protein M231_04697 [Tremella mesenterica]|uniref:Uncharacterized protein n=1 Tax=Tremella mesenterica TaxID=5217 RepID=A0A4Q1BJV3_TREME|nr:hypothetical protein M231_04697 [Tremella mesenterica]
MNFGPSTRRFSQGDTQSLEVSRPRRSCSAPLELNRIDVTRSPWSPSSSITVPPSQETVRTPFMSKEEGSCVMYETRNYTGLPIPDIVSYIPQSLSPKTHRPARSARSLQPNLQGREPVEGLLFSGPPPSPLIGQVLDHPFPIVSLGEHPASSTFNDHGACPPSIHASAIWNPSPLTSPQFNLSDDSLPSALPPFLYTKLEAKKDRPVSRLLTLLAFSRSEARNWSNENGHLSAMVTGYPPSSFKGPAYKDGGHVCCTPSGNTDWVPQGAPRSSGGRSRWSWERTGRLKEEEPQIMSRSGPISPFRTIWSPTSTVENTSRVNTMNSLVSLSVQVRIDPNWEQETTRDPTRRKNGSHVVRITGT